MNGYKAVMSCDSEANPQLESFTWSLNNCTLLTNSAKCTLLSAKEGDTITTFGSLTLKNVQQSDFEIYVCQVVTDAGSGSGVFNLTLSCEQSKINIFPVSILK